MDKALLGMLTRRECIAGTCVLTMSVASGAAFAQTIVEGGLVETNTVWTPEGSPYVVTAPLRVLGSGSLTIDPATQVWLEAQGQLLVEGALWAEGLPGSAVTFRGTAPRQAWGPIAPFLPDATTDSSDEVIVKLFGTANDTILALYNSTTQIGRNERVTGYLIRRSVDAGRTWSDPAEFIAFADFAADSRGTWMAVWTSTANPDGTLGDDADVFCSVSRDDAVSWSEPVLVNNDADVDHFLLNPPDDMLPRVETDGDGRWMVVWAGYKPIFQTTRDLDVVFALSDDLGETWSDPAHVNNLGSSDADLDTDQSGVVVSLGPGSWLVLWQSNSTFGGSFYETNSFVARTNDNGTTWTYPVVVNSNATEYHEDLSLMDFVRSPTGRLLAGWTSSDHRLGFGADRDLFYSFSDDDGETWSELAPLNANAGTDSGYDSDLALAVDEDGTWIGVWGSTDELNFCGVDCGIGTDSDLLFSVSYDDGASWTWPMPLHANAHGDDGSDGEPEIMNVDAFRWLVLWTSNDTFGGTLGEDRDLLLARAIVPDSDADNIPDPEDNCPAMWNTDQADGDGDGAGDLCDACQGTQPGILTDVVGRPAGDLDYDCDVDLADHAIMQFNFAGPGAGSQR
ncbi:MAG: sialidase family protein [Phycisphaerae bacterium]|jgi:hypothetical protein